MRFSSLVLAAILSLLMLVGCGTQLAASPPAATRSPDDEAIAAAFKARVSGVQVTGEGTVTRVLADDIEGDRHQRFIVRISSGQTLLIAHNIDVAPRVPDIAPGDAVAFSGIYEWNAEGGVVHWTHRDPTAVHQPGWLRFKGTTYQ